MDQLEGPFAMLLAAILIRSAIRVMWRRQANGAAFGLGIAAAVFNPMSIAFFLSFFVAHQAFLSSAWIAPAVVFVMAALWFSLVGICLGRLPKVEIDPMLASYPKLAVEISMIAYAFYVVRTAL